MFVLYVRVSTSVLQILSITFSRFHIHALIYDICFSVSDFTHFLTSKSLLVCSTGASTGKLNIILKMLTLMIIYLVTTT